MFTITLISLLPSSQGRFGWFPSHLYFSKFHRPFQVQGRTFRTLIYLKLDSLERCWWAPPLSSPRLHVFWSSCASHNDIFIIYMLWFSGWLLFSFTWNMVHTVRAGFVTVWNDLHQLHLFHFAAGGEGLGHINQSKTFWNTRWSYRFSCSHYFWTYRMLH